MEKICKTLIASTIIGAIITGLVELGYSAAMKKANKVVFEYACKHPEETFKDCLEKIKNHGA